MSTKENISRRKFLGAVSAGTIGSGLVNMTFAAGQEKLSANQAVQKPNILVIICDQMTPFLTGVYGHPVVKTPNLNKLAKEGIRFNAAYSPCPLCAPARACLMTGKYSSNNKVYDNAAPLYCDELTIAHYLTNAGYETIANGKMHFIGADQLHGFQKRLTTDLQHADFTNTKSRDHKVPQSHAQQYIADAIKIGVDNRRLQYDENVMTNALQVLHQKGLDNSNAKRNGDTVRPFFLYTSFWHPHEPFWPPQEYWDMYENDPIDIPEFPDNLEETYSIMDKWLNTHHGVDKVDLRNPAGLRKLRRAYYALVTYIDAKVGKLLNSLKENGLEEDTIVIFTSDHGDMLCEKGMVQKRSFYEWSSRVPLVIRFPDKAMRGSVCEQPVSLIDVLPTVLDMAGVKKDNRLSMDGKSLLGLIEGTDHTNRIVFSEMHSEGVYATCFMVREGKYKYIYIHGYDSQLFDLQKDPGEWHNLSGNPEYNTFEKRFKALIFDQFNPDEIEKELRKSLQKRTLIRQVMKINKINWRFTPSA